MGEYPGIDMNNYNTGGSAQETNANIVFPEFV
jgi:hypothetical protein